MRTLILIVAITAVPLLTVAGCGPGTVDREKLEEAIEKQLSDAREGYQATCPDNVSWSNPRDEKFPCQLTDKHTRSSP